MNIVWLSWKDRDHHLAGGAEEVSGELMDRLAANGHNIRHITARYPKSEVKSTPRKNLVIYRVGNRFSVYPKARRLFMRTCSQWADVVIDEMNTIPFGAGFYAKNSTNILLSYQLAREVWFYQMMLPLSLVGYLIEPLMVRVLSFGNYRRVATESRSSQLDIERYGLKNVRTFRVGIATKPIQRLPEKGNLTTVLSLGSIRPMKRTLDAVKAFEVAHSKNPSLRLVIAGENSSKYAQKVMHYIHNSPHREAIDIVGRVTNEKRLKLMRDSAAILVTSIKEGWGLIVTEANSQGTPAVVYDVDGLRDSVVNKKTGVIVKSGNPKAMGVGLVNMLNNPEQYKRYRQEAWTMSKEYTFENSYADFMKIIDGARKNDKK